MEKNRIHVRVDGGPDCLLIGDSNDRIIYLWSRNRDISREPRCISNIVKTDHKGKIKIKWQGKKPMEAKKREREEKKLPAPIPLILIGSELFIILMIVALIQA